MVDRDLTAESMSAEGVRVVMIDHTTSLGGAELALPRLVRASRHRWTMTFLEPVVGLIFPAGVPIEAPSRRLGLFKQLLFLRRVLRRNADAVVVSNTLRAALLVAVLKMRGQRHVQILHDGLDEGSLSTVKRLLSSWTLRSVDLILPNSRWTASTVPERFASKVGSVIYSPSGDPVRLSGTVSEIDDLHRPIRLLSLSRLVEWKGIHTLLSALGDLSDLPADALSVTIAGEAVMGRQEYVDELRRSARKLKFEVDFIGHLEDVRPQLRAHDVLVHASIRPEPFGQVIVQGLSHGLAVVASRGGGPSEIIDDLRSGVLFTAGDEHDLARALRTVVSDHQLRLGLQRGALQRSALFDDQHCADLFDDSITELTNRRARRNT